MGQAGADTSSRLRSFSEKELLESVIQKHFPSTRCKRLEGIKQAGQ